MNAYVVAVSTCMFKQSVLQWASKIPVIITKGNRSRVGARRHGDSPGAKAVVAQ
jgi:hypothetical protein